MTQVGTGTGTYLSPFSLINLKEDSENNIMDLDWVIVKFQSSSFISVVNLRIIKSMDNRLSIKSYF